MKGPFLILFVAIFATILPAFAARSLPTVPANPAQNYAKHCASCHGSDGRAKTLKGKLKHARNLADSEWQEKVSDERIFNSIMNGKGKMPAYSKKLSQEDIDGLVNYVRGLKK